MAEVVVIVRQDASGWFVEDEVTAGPFVSKESALEAAHGIMFAHGARGDCARIIVAEAE